MDKLLGWNEILDYSLYLRGIIVTIYAIILFRANSARLYGNYSPLDFIIYIILGGILGGAIVSNLPLLPFMIVCLIIVGLHRFLAYLSYKSHKIGVCIKGDKTFIIQNGEYMRKNISCCHITPNDILQSLRQKHGIESIASIEKAILERDGQISFIFKSTKKK